MNHRIEALAKALKAARERSGMTQRALALKTGLPQSHISKIEAGAIDLRLSSAIELARTLDLELMLVPRKVIGAVHSIARSVDPGVSSPSPATLKEFQRLRDAVLPLVENDAGLSKEAAQVQRALRELEQLTLRPSQIQLLRDTNDALRKPGGAVTLRTVLERLRSMRNQAVLTASEPKAGETVRPAYNLDDDEDDHA